MDPIEEAAARPPPAPRPLDDLGPPSDPLPFPRPQLMRGRRDTVCVYNADTDEHEVVENVLFRDFARNPHEGGAGTGGTSSAHNIHSNETTTRYAYWPNPYKEPIQT